MNLKDKDAIIAVGKDGPSEKGVKGFALKFSEFMGVEMGGYTYSEDGSGTVTDVQIGRYATNKNKECHFGLGSLRRKYGNNFSLNNVMGDYHTHPDGQLGATRDAPSLSDDVKNKNKNRPGLPNATFTVVYRPYTEMEEYDYTDN